MIILSDSTLYSVGLSGDNFNSYANFSNYKPAVLYDGTNHFIVGAKNTGSNTATLNVLVYNDNTIFLKSIDISDAFSSAPVVYKANNYSIEVSTIDGKTYVFTLPTDANDKITYSIISSSSSQSLVKIVKSDAGDDSYLTSKQWFNAAGKKYSELDNAIDFITFKDSKSNNINAILDKNKAVLCFRSGR